MTLLRRRMIEDMQVLNLAPMTQSTYLLQVTLFARRVVVAESALRFLYRRTLHKDWHFDQVIPAPQQSDGFQ